MADTLLDSGMDEVQKRLMFDDDTLGYNSFTYSQIPSVDLELLDRCILVDENDRVQRSATKVTFPLVWTNTCCSHPLYRESELIEEEALGARNAAQRKLLDELGIPAEDVPVDQFIPILSPVSPCNSMEDALLDAGMDEVQKRRICILVDENDRVVGHESNVFLFNSKYELLIQQRSAKKVTFPLAWTDSCCSHPLYKESDLVEEDALGARKAAQRKLLHELGIPAEDIPVDQIIPVGRMLYKAPSDVKWGEHELDYLLFIVRDVNVNPNPNEVADVKYVNKEELEELVRKVDAGEEGLKLSPWFRLVVDNFLFKWWDHVEKGTLKEAADMKTIHKLT
ncbi:Isopentenyl-diphosphate Delta-isomerase I [Cucurbita argyrosperma subsp. argyrosperma]|nr:Isopentenyl-diphosphate Delta-isomerase I [Cucurbita argyrosperma subsp. argyrosperma]